ncbi:AraC family transcriptional regulator [Candidatus Litorirhabdus singularis]|nr:AraC family transcriptional regulator [Candidatus Litorirhabdus singularis]
MPIAVDGTDTVPLKYLRTLLRAAGEQGYDTDTIISRLGLPPTLMEATSDANTPVAAATYNRVYTHLMSLLQDESLGISMRQPTPSGSFRMLALYVIHCGTLENAFLRADEFQTFCRQLAGLPAVNREPLRYLEDGRVLHIMPDASEFAAQNTELAWYSIAHTMAVWRRFSSWLIGTSIDLHEVHIQLPEPADPGYLARIFDCPLLFDSEHNGFVFDASYLQAPLMHDEESLKAFLRNAPFHLLANSEVESDEGIVAQMRRVVGIDLSRDFPSVVDMAERLHMSVRTLRRRLNEVGTTYQEFKDRTRCDAATRLLNRPELKINAVAVLLGFDEPSAFHRSFKKWTGLTPGEYRQSLYT